MAKEEKRERFQGGPTSGQKSSCGFSGKRIARKAREEGEMRAHGAGAGQQTL